MENYQITLSITNVNIDQTIPAGSTSQAANLTAFVDPSKRALHARAVNIEQNITTQAANVGYSYLVNVPQGRYRITGRLNDPARTQSQSNVFTVVQGSNIGCIDPALLAVASASASPSSSRPTSTGASVSRSSSAAGSASASPSQSAGSNAGSESESDSGGISGGAIGGIVVGVVGGLALLGLLFLCLRRRKRTAEMARSGEDGYGGPEMKDRSGSMANRLSAVLPSSTSHPQHAGGIGRRSDDRHIALTSLGGSAEDDRDGGALDSNGSFGSEASTPIYLAQNPVYNEGRGGTTNPFASAPTTPRVEDDLENGYPLPIASAKSSSSGRRRSGPPTALSTRHGSNAPSRQPSLGDGDELGRARADSQSDDAGTPGVGAGVARSTSKRRKPVPSLGPELRSELKRKGSVQEKMPSAPITGERRMSGMGLGAGSGGDREVLRQSGTFQLMPDPPSHIDSR